MAVRKGTRQTAYRPRPYGPRLVRAVTPEPRFMLRLLQRLLVWLYEWLACAESSSEGDLIFALAGRQSRKSYALEMLLQGRARQLLLSVGRFEIRSFGDLPFPVRLNLPAVAASVSPAQRYLFVHLVNKTSEVVFIHKGRLGTLSEILALKAWLAARSEIKSVLIVSSAAHLRRVRLCCRSLLPAFVHFRLVAADKDGLRPDLWWRTSKTMVIVLLEFPKLLLYWLVFTLRVGNRACRHFGPQPL